MSERPPASSPGNSPRSPLSGPSPALLLARGVCRALDQLGYASLTEFPLASGQRADILALGRTGDLVIVEIKSSVADFRADRKWAGYREFADRLYFAVPNDFPMILIPEECGLIVAAALGATVLAHCLATPLASAPPATPRAPLSGLPPPPP